MMMTLPRYQLREHLRQVAALHGLSDYQVESFVRSVAAEMEALGYDTRLADASGPDVRVCMAKPAHPELCTDLKESGQPWVIYSPSNIANMQADRYGFMYLGEETPPEASRQQQQTPTYYPASVSFLNTTTGDESVLYVGDSWTLEVSGDPNAEVLSSGSGPGGAWSGTSHGRTNSQGTLRITGSMSQAEIGQWRQTWTVGGRQAGNLNFEVKARPSQQEQREQEEKPGRQPSGAADEVQQIIVQRGLPSTEDLTGWAKDNLLLVGGAAVVLFLLLGRGK